MISAKKSEPGRRPKGQTSKRRKTESERLVTDGGGKFLNFRLFPSIIRAKECGSDGVSDLWNRLQGCCDLP